MQKIAQWVLLLAVTGFAVGIGYEKYGPIDFGNQKFPGPAEAAKLVCDNPPTTYELQIVQLPEDGLAYHTSLFLPADWKNDKQSRELVAWFETDAKLRSLRSQTHWHIYTVNDPIFGRYRNMVPVVPAVVVQKPSGQKMYAAAADGLPKTANLLAADIQGNLFANCPNRPKPPEPVAPQPVAPVNGPPTLDEPPVVPADAFPLVLAGLAAIGGLAAGVGTKYYEQYYKSV